MAYRHEQHQLAVVAVARTPAEADLLRVTLAAHGFEASVAASFSAYPSVDFVEGIGVFVKAADEAAVRELLRKLERQDENDA